jgi:hypothetical protein
MIKNIFKVAITDTGKLKKEYTSPSDLAWSNLQQGARVHHLGFVISAINGWLRANPGKTLQDLEQRLRQHKIPVHIIASTKIQTTHEGKELYLRPLFKDSPPPTYQVLYSCKPDSLALNEITEHWESYSENFGKLPEAGLLTYKKEGFSESKPYFGDTSDAMTIKGMEAIQAGNQMEAIAYNCVQLICKDLNQTELQQDLENDLKVAKETLKKDPMKQIIETTEQECTVTAFMVEKKLVSALGVMTSKDGKKKRIVNLEDQRSWTWEDQTTD